MEKRKYRALVIVGVFGVAIAGGVFLAKNHLKKAVTSELARNIKASAKQPVKSVKALDPALAPKASPEATAPLVDSAHPQLISLPILMYHHVGALPPNPDALRRDLTVSAENFTAQVGWLKSAGYNAITLQQLEDFTKGQFTLPIKPIVLTFDDGYSDVFETAVPILVKNGYAGSFAIITHFTGTTQGTNQYATWEQLLAAKSAGMDIVSHTQDHFDGSNIVKYSNDFILNDLQGAKKDLADHGINTDILIYPYGHYTLDYLAQAKKAGYTMGLTVRFGKEINTDDLMELPRVRVHGEETLERFKEILQK